MPFNLLKVYPELLEIDHLNEKERRDSLMKIFVRDIQDNTTLNFRTKKIWPTKHDPISMEVLFDHLTTEEIEVKRDELTAYLRRDYEPDRSKRLHWVRYHIEENKKIDMDIFSAEERVKGSNVIRTYIFDKTQKYVVVLEPQNTGRDYYLITAYYLNRDWGEKAMKKRMKKRLPAIH
jgi:hypothetical protein